MIDAYKTYFFATIGRSEGSPAPDWKAVLESLPGRGFGVNPKPGVIMPAGAPHHGITVMIDAGGNARGRIWLPTDIQEPGGWFTHEIQVIADGPTPGSFVWAWQDKGGAPVRPFVDGAQPPNPTPEPQPPSDVEERIAALERDVALLHGDLLKLRGDIAPAVREALRGATLKITVGRNWGHGHAAEGTIEL